MREFALFQVDAFTRHPLQGNPCAVVLDADRLSGGEMQAIAREMNLSETAFLLSSEVADHRARYFTPAEEIPLAGHPTIATAVTLVEAGRLPSDRGPVSFSLELQAGIITVKVEPGGAGPTLTTMTQPAPRFLRSYPGEAVAPVFDLTPEDFLPGVPLQTVSTGTPMLMAPVRDLEVLRRASLDLRAYEQLRGESDFFSVHLFCLEGVSAEGDTFARHFGVPPDTWEDPFTGSASGAMGGYLWKYDLLDEPRFTAEQGHWMGRPGQARVSVLGTRANMEAVLVGGYGVPIISGSLFLGAERHRKAGMSLGTETGLHHWPDGVMHLRIPR